MRVSNDVPGNKILTQDVCFQKNIKNNVLGDHTWLMLEALQNTIVLDTTQHMSLDRDGGVEAASTTLKIVGAAVADLLCGI